MGLQHWPRTAKVYQNFGPMKKTSNPTAERIKAGPMRHDDILCKRPACSLIIRITPSAHAQRSYTTVDAGTVGIEMCSLCPCPCSIKRRSTRERGGVAHLTAGTAPTTITEGTNPKYPSTMVRFHRKITDFPSQSVPYLCLLKSVSSQKPHVQNNINRLVAPRRHW